jgi:hypothetical protein
LGGAPSQADLVAGFFDSEADPESDFFSEELDDASELELFESLDDFESLEPLSLLALESLAADRFDDELRLSVL